MAYYSKSSTGWETSYFGGFSKVLWDHPDVYVPLEIDWKEPEDPVEGLSYYTKTKLIKLFLLKLNQKSEYGNGAEAFFYYRGMEIKKESFFGLYEKEYLYIPKNNIKACLEILSHDPDLSSLFINYQDFLADTQFFIEIPKKDKKEGESDNPLRDALSKVKPALNEIKIRKSSFSFGSSIKYDDDRAGKLKENGVFQKMNKFDIPIHFDQKCIAQANHLVRLLDISFDPKKDIVPNLKTGKLNSSKIGEIPAGNTHVYYKIEENQSTKPFSVCILGDESGSMQGSNQYYQHHLFKVLYKAFSEILPKEKMFFYGHSGEDHPEIRVYHDPFNQDFEYTIKNQTDGNYYCENYDGPVIDLVYEKVRSFTDDNIIFISISDGEPSGKAYGGQSAIDDMKRIIEKCKRDGFVTIGVGLEYNVKNIYNYHTVVTDNNKLVEQVSTIINKVVKTEFQD
jgi:hypothetical protein